MMNLEIFELLRATVLDPVHDMVRPLMSWLLSVLQPLVPVSYFLLEYSRFVIAHCHDGTYLY